MALSSIFSQIRYAEDPVLPADTSNDYDRIPQSIPLIFQSCNLRGIRVYWHFVDWITGNIYFVPLWTEVSLLAVVFFLDTRSRGHYSLQSCFLLNPSLMVTAPFAFPAEEGAGTVVDHVGSMFSKHIDFSLADKGKCLVLNFSIRPDLLPPQVPHSIANPSAYVTCCLFICRRAFHCKP